MSLGIQEQSLDHIQAAMTAFEAALTVRTKSAAPIDWAGTRHNMAIAFRAQARITQDPHYFDQADTAYQDALLYRTAEKAPYYWADTVGGLGELALDRFDMDGDPAHLDRAEQHIQTAQGVMDIADEYLAERCEGLLTRIAEARKTLEIKALPSP